MANRTRPRGRSGVKGKLKKQIPRSLDRRLLDKASSQIENLLKQLEKGKKSYDKSSQVIVSLGQSIIRKAQEVRKHVAKDELVRVSRKATTKLAKVWKSKQPKPSPKKRK